ncbi:nucleotide exchange factor GrpE [Microseira sp. BLCC-F43]|jgi:molecular chaperone GrpE (heat shock protein)|uniref:nucleotide exchange factor GrpE n=1 Tax=Microseira sp. BLCC-F43 TaxID=3153602 RepID=UPI0035BA13BA
MDDNNLFWFGLVLWLVIILLGFSFFRSPKDVEDSGINDRITASREIEELRQECLRLREQLQQQSRQLTVDFQSTTFSQLQTLLTNYPSVRQMVKAKPDLPAKNIISLFIPLDNMLKSWGYEPIGSPWEQVPYNPQLHQGDTDDMREGELVYVRFVGYRDGSRILSPAKVSRTLPIASK